MTLTFEGQIIHGSTRLDKANTMVSKSLLYLYNYRFYRPKTVLENFGILTPGDLNFDLSQKMTEMISKRFFASFRRCFPFCSTMRRSRDRRRGVFKHPPPPAGGGKSRGPAGRGLTSYGLRHFGMVRLPRWKMCRILRLYSHVFFASTPIDI